MPLGPIWLDKRVGNLICAVCWGHKHDSGSPANLQLNKSPSKFVYLQQENKVERVRIIEDCLKFFLFFFLFDK